MVCKLCNIFRLLIKTKIRYRDMKTKIGGYESPCRAKPQTVHALPRGPTSEVEHRGLEFDGPFINRLILLIS